jgi:putative ABC transport system ATP-binding protein
MEKTLIEIKNLHKDYQLGKTTVNALRGINLSIKEGRFYSIIGASGSGKSSLLHLLGCLDIPTAGTIEFRKCNISNLKEHELTNIRAKEIGFIFQNFQLNPILTALDNVAIALRVAGKDKKTARQHAKNMLIKVGLEDRLYHYPNELSGGQRQRVAIARALVKKPSLILADEPTGNLDSVNSMEIIKLLRELVNEYQITVILVTHNVEIMQLADKNILIKDGLILN